MYYKTIAILVTAAWLAGCTGSEQPMADQEPDAPTIDQVEEEVTEAVETAAEYVSNERDEFVARIEEDVANLNNEIKALREEIAETGAESQKAFDEALAAMDEKREAVGDELDQLKSASGEAWKDVRAGVENAVQELQQAYDNARSRFDDNSDPQPAEEEAADPAGSEQ